MKKNIFSDLKSHYEHDIKSHLELQETFFFFFIFLIIVDNSTNLFWNWLFWCEKYKLMVQKQLPCVSAELC